MHIDDMAGLETVTIAVRFPLGSRDDASPGAGIPHLLEHLLLSAPVGGYPSLSYLVESLGGQANAFTGKEHITALVRVLREDAPMVARLLRTALAEPEFTTAVFIAERDVVLEELAEASSDPGDVVQDEIFRQVFPQHPLGWLVGGSADSVASLELADVERWWADRAAVVAPDVVVVGHEVTDDVREALGFPGGRSHQRPAVGLGEPAPSMAVSGLDAGFAWLVAGSRSVPRDHEQRFAWEVLAHAFGESPSSLLYDRLRTQQGLVYFLHTWCTTYSDSGLWRTRIGVRSSRAERVLDELRKCLEEVADRGLPDAVLESAKKQATVAVVLERENPADRALQLCRLSAADSQGQWTWADEVEALRKVTTDELAEVARTISAQLTWTVQVAGGNDDD